MAKITDRQVCDIGHVLNDVSRPLKERFRALFTLRNIGGATAIRCIDACFGDGSALLKHELAYCLGQMQDPGANAILQRVLGDARQEPMVRHEAAEALGAIGSPAALASLRLHRADAAVEVAETCELALERIRWLGSAEAGEAGAASAYSSVDPAPPARAAAPAALKRTLVDETAPLFERYRAMFALRNLGTAEAVEALGAGFGCKSALFKHEVAFVFGQMQHEGSVRYLIRALEDRDENEMVRHECAEALGAIATEECTRVLQKYLSDERQVVKESCVIALDMCEYENSPEFQYANTLQ